MAIANTNYGSGAPPRLRCYFNMLAFDDMPAYSTECEERLRAVSKAGYHGVQFVAPMTAAERKACEHSRLGRASSGRVNEPADAAPLAERFVIEGMECATLHVGWGIEDDDEAYRLIDAVLNASARYKMPLYVETHRATIFQDLWRTVQFVKRFPDLRFNGDFSHWYTGSEFVYGGFEKKMEFIAPVLERVRFVHGRIGDPGCIQVDIGDGGPVDRPYVAHFRALWTASFRGFLATARAGDYIIFAPELLSARIYYRRSIETTDRWEQSLLLRRIAEECFIEAATDATIRSA